MGADFVSTCETSSNTHLVNCLHLVPQVLTTLELTVRSRKPILRQEPVGKEGKVLRDVLRQELGKRARDSIGLDRERDSILGALH